ncbi:hypothetical protein [Methanogenium cariaci]|uniref:hypothetical protein n=1 Tax=Methanogenium cariaci TaxID=2197 RepID=UPI0012F6E193|nr:hypothetical protein [Methanogenium cariaci]
MMSSSVAGNRSASHNGYSGEAYASLKYGLTINSRTHRQPGPPPVEVKSCQTVIKDHSRPPRSLSPAAGG